VNARLRRYWFKFKTKSGSPLGYGVSAWTEADARAILQQEVFRDLPLPDAELTADVDVRTLDQGHVIPNMESPMWRGIWFPKGYVKWS